MRHPETSGCKLVCHADQGQGLPPFCRNEVCRPRLGCSLTDAREPPFSSSMRSIDFADSPFSRDMSRTSCSRWRMAAVDCEFSRLAAAIDLICLVIFAELTGICLKVMVCSFIARLACFV